MCITIVLAVLVLTGLVIMHNLDRGCFNKYDIARRDINRISTSAHSHIGAISDDYLRRVRDNTRR